MSSLAGALDAYPHNKPNSRSHRPSDDVEMHTMPQSPRNVELDEDDEEMSDLFGNDNDLEERKNGLAQASPTSSGPESERLPSPERERRQALEYEEEDAPPEIAVEVKEAEVAFPNLPVPKSSDGDNWVVRMPNFMNLDSKPFHPDTYMGPEHDEDDPLHASNIREKSMSIKLKVENTLRWRWTKDASGNDQRQSNARIVRWSDGTLSLRVGKEFFDIDQSIDNSGGVQRQTLGTPSQSQSQSQTPMPPSTPGRKSQGLTYLVAQHKRSQVLQSEAVITGYMSLRPTGMQSETHRMLVRAVGQKHNRVARLLMAPEPTVDPEREKLELMKQSARKSKRKADDIDGLGSGKKKRSGGRSTDRDVLWSDDEDGGGLYGASEDEDEDGGIGHRSGSSPKKIKRKSGDDGGEEYQADDFVVPDDSDDEGGGGSKRKRAREASDMEEDPLDRMEANLEQQAAEKRHAERKKGPTPKGHKKDEDDDDTEEDANAMDVESEEEDEFKVRRVTSKRAIALEEEEEE